MAITVSGLKRYSLGSALMNTGQLAFDSSYLSGGEPLSARKLGLHQVKSMEISPVDGYVFSYDYTNAAVLVYRASGFTPAGTLSTPTFTGSEMAMHTHSLFLSNADVVDGATTRVNAGQDLLGANTGDDLLIAGVPDGNSHGGIIQITAGTPAGTVSAPTFTGSAVAAGPLVEVTNGTNLSGLAGVRFRVIGY